MQSAKNHNGFYFLRSIGTKLLQIQIEGNFTGLVTLLKGVVPTGAVDKFVG